MNLFERVCARWERRATRPLSLGLAILLSACSGKGRDAPEPVPECQAYEAAFARCTGTRSPIASQPAAMASSEAERAQLKELCVLNMAQLKQACR
jgi:hypothetical protein